MACNLFEQVIGRVAVGGDPEHERCIISILPPRMPPKEAVRFGMVAHREGSCEPTKLYLVMVQRGLLLPLTLDVRFIAPNGLFQDLEELWMIVHREIGQSHSRHFGVITTGLVEFLHAQPLTVGEHIQCNATPDRMFGGE